MFAGGIASGVGGLLREPFTLEAVVTVQRRRGFLFGG